MTAHNPLDDRESEARFESQLDAIASCLDDEIRGIAYALEICKASVGVPEAPDSENKPDPIYAGRFGTLILAVARDPSAVKFTLPRLEEEHISLLHPAEVSRLGEVAIGLMNKPELHGDPQKGIISWLVNAVLNSSPSILTIQSLHGAAKESGLTEIEDLLDIAKRVVDDSESFMQAVELKGPGYFEENPEVSTAPEVAPERPASLDLDRTEEAEAHPHMELLEEFEKLYIDYEESKSVELLIADIEDSVVILTEIIDLSCSHFDPLHPEYIDPEIARLATKIVDEIYHELAAVSSVPDRFQRPMDRIIQAKLRQITSLQDPEKFCRQLSEFFKDLPQHYNLRDIEQIDCYMSFMEKRFAASAVEHAKRLLVKHKVDTPRLLNRVEFANLDFISGQGYVEFDDFASFSRGMKSVFDFEVPTADNIDFGSEYEIIQKNVGVLIEDLQGLSDVEEPSSDDKTVYTADISVPFPDDLAGVRVEFVGGKFKVAITNLFDYRILAALSNNGGGEIQFYGPPSIQYSAEMPSFPEVRWHIGETDPLDAHLEQTDRGVDVTADIDVAQFNLDRMFEHFKAIGLTCETMKEEFLNAFLVEEPKFRAGDIDILISKNSWQKVGDILRTSATAKYTRGEKGILHRLEVSLPQITLSFVRPSEQSVQLVAALKALQENLAMVDHYRGELRVRGNTVDYISGRLDYPR